MCGIVGYIGKRESQPILLEGLKKLEYRGYDSAGIAVFTNKGLEVTKSKGRIAILESLVTEEPLKGSVGIGHTRWATHGRPSDINSHPHTDNTSKISVVHNGIIENFRELREELQEKGNIFLSETDTEVISHLIGFFYEGDIVKAVQRAVTSMRGAYAIAVLCEDEPEKLVAVRSASPLIIGLGDGENFIGSDIPAILDYTRDVYVLEDGDMAILTRDGVELMTLEGNPITRDSFHVDWDITTAEKAGFDHFMLKEIFEQPKAYQDTMGSRIDVSGERVVLPELQMLTDDVIRGLRNIHIVACGTASYAGMVGKQIIEKLARIPVEWDVASEYRYRSPIITKETLVIVVSQSGETADTLAALREAQRCGAKVLAITNVVGSSVAREADDVIVTWAGPEIAVASTKAYSSQLIAFYLLGLYMAQVLNTKDSAYIHEVIAAMQELPEQVNHILQQSEKLKVVAESVSAHNNLFFIGRGLDYAVSLEGSLKLKEISYIHSEAYPAGELKHGTLALIEEGVPVIALATQDELFEKMVSNIIEVASRGAYILGIANEGNLELKKSVDDVFYIPNTMPLLTPALSVVPLQLVAYYASLARGNDVDKPRNLAKSVTVE
jgi:glucosamine--fructose-6-phosphate aminotransferase (isomerizing)